jgi:hypothetical protein
MAEQGLPSDRFKVNGGLIRKGRNDVKRSPRKLDLAHFLAAEIDILNPSQIGSKVCQDLQRKTLTRKITDRDAAMLCEIPADFSTIKSGDPALALSGVCTLRVLRELLFQNGYLVKTLSTFLGVQLQLMS